MGRGVFERRDQSCTGGTGIWLTTNRALSPHRDGELIQGRRRDTKCCWGGVHIIPGTRGTCQGGKHLCETPALALLPCGNRGWGTTRSLPCPHGQVRVAAAARAVQGRVWSGAAPGAGHELKHLPPPLKERCARRVGPSEDYFILGKPWASASSAAFLGHSTFTYAK